ncbi:molybdenum cofactor guanylyltransferase [Marinifilum sp.]|uniref:molybdenum cofactor guanylyltransferase n=1 Tax=Marinifilum sp. TaxID=2033137 RepID=UPI003BA9B222
MVQRTKKLGIILCGGKSSRMGTEKGLVEWKGKALIEYSVDCLKNICDELLVSSNSDFYHYLNFRVIKDEIMNCGPIGGIYSCMKEVKADYYFVISCDVPNVTSSLYQDLLKNIGTSDLIYAVDEFGKKQPLVSIFKSTSFSVIEKELVKGNYKMMKLLSLIPHVEFNVLKGLDYYSPTILSNVNSADELRNL